MRTLDKMWKHVQSEDNDIMMEEDEQKAETTLNNQNQSNDKTTNNAENNDADNNDARTDPATLEKSFTFAVRFKITADTPSQAYQQHKNVLVTMGSELGLCKMASKEEEYKQSTDICPGMFDYHEVGKRNKQYIVVHTMIANVEYHTLKRNPTIFEALKHNKCYLQQHIWKNDIWNIVTIGFLSGASPKHEAKDILQGSIDETVPDSPMYELGAAMIKMRSNGEEYNTFAYEIKCQYEQMDEVCKHLVNEGKKLNVTLLKHKWKYTHPEVYVNGIKKQNEYFRSIRTIPIYGITRKAMDYLHQELISEENILNVCSTPNTTTHGRWNVYTTASRFKETTQWLQENIQKLYQKFCADKMSDDDVPLDFIQEVKFNSVISFDPPKKDIYLDDATSSVSKYSNSSANTASWASVVGKSYTNAPSKTTFYTSGRSSIPTTSSISNSKDFSETLNNINESIKDIRLRLEKLELAVENQERALETTRKFEAKITSDMARLTNTLESLEERTNRVEPRRLELSFEATEPNKRRDIRSSPSKGQRL